MSAPPIHSPAKFTPVYGLGFANQAGAIEVASTDSPLPVALSQSQPVSAPLAGSTGVSQIVGPFSPTPGVPVTVLLAGTWQGSVHLSRSLDAGASRHPLTAAGTAWARFTAKRARRPN